MLKKTAKKILTMVLALILTLSPFVQTVLAEETDSSDNSSNNMYENSDFIETEQPELNAETKALISQYHKNPTEENYLSLRAQVIANYDLVLVRKEAKLAELIVETAGKPGGEERVTEMREIVQEMYMTYWNRINSNMLRFTDTRLLKWSIDDAANYEYIPVMGAGETIEVKRTTVTNAEYGQYLAATGYEAPSNWTEGTYPEGEEDYPVNYISYADAKAYCEWLTQMDGTNVYRLPNESEWELAAGHMPKDAEFNCGINDGRTSVEEYADVTRGAHGAIDFWGNVWEWTSTVRTSVDGTEQMAVKGGSWKSERTDCRTEYRKEGREASLGHEDTGFRVIKVLGGVEPEQKVELATLEAPVVTASLTEENAMFLSWQPVEGAVMYQLFTYDTATGLVAMFDLIEDTSYIVENAADGIRYIVQPISYTSICDNVYGEYSVGVETAEDDGEVGDEETENQGEETTESEGGETDGDLEGETEDKTIITPTYSYDYNRSKLTLYWEPVEGVEIYYVYKYDQSRQLLTKPKEVTADTQTTSKKTITTANTNDSNLLSTNYKVEPGTTCSYLITTEEVANRRGYSGENCITIVIPEQE